MFTQKWGKHCSSDMRHMCVNMRYTTLKYNRSFLLSDLNLNPTQRKWNNINASPYSQDQDNTATDSQSTTDDLNLELDTLTKEKVQLQKVSIAFLPVVYVAI